jgi:hypothetical protein
MRVFDDSLSHDDPLEEPEGRFCDECWSSKLSYRPKASTTAGNLVRTLSGIRIYGALGGERR